MKNIYIKDLYSSNSDEIELKCWLLRKRVHSEFIFLDLVDSTGKIQGVVSKKDFPALYDSLKRLKDDSAISVNGEVESGKEGLDFNIRKVDVAAESTLNLTPNPRKIINPFSQSYVERIGLHPTFYMRNEKIAAAVKVKSYFKKNLADFFWEKGFMQFDPPTITLQTLYDDDSAFWIKINGQDATLSRCATFHLEPALFAYEKVFAITNSFSNERSRSDRHLSEYTHLKAELAWVNLDELIDFAGNMYYEVSKKTVHDCKDEISVLGLFDTIDERVEKINPENAVLITYDDAFKILMKKEIDFEYGKSLSTADEKIITNYFGEKFVWIKYIPRSAEGFPFKIKTDSPHLTMACDLISSNGFGEILGTAEKITDYDELLERMNEKGKISDEQIARYADYLDLRKNGLPDHGGIGMGIERAVRYLLNLPHVRNTKAFPVVFGTKVNF